MLRKILIFIILSWFNINSYAQEVITKNARSIEIEEEEPAAEEIPLEGISEEDQEQLEALFQKLEETIKMIDGLKEENANLRRGYYSSVDSQYLEKMNQQLQQEKIALAESARKKEAELCEELGTAYVQAKLYDKAIEAYSQAIKLDPKNAEANYNLGLLYRHSQSDNKKGARHLKKYLQLNPKAKNKKEVEYLIELMRSAPKRKFIKYY